MINWLVDMIVNGIILSLILSVPIFGIVYVVKKNKGKHFSSKIATFIFIHYIILLLYMTIYRDGLFMNDIHKINLNVFTVLIDGFKNLSYYDQNSAYFYVIYNVLGNILWFVPFGFLLAMLFTRLSWYKVILITCLLSISIEFTQYIFYVGVSDIDDIIFNTIGGFTGYVFYILSTRRERRYVHKDANRTFLESILIREE